MKNYAILNSDVFLYDLLTDGRFCSDVFDLCRNGKLTLIYNDLLLEDYLDIYKNNASEDEQRYKKTIERIKTFGIELDITSIKNVAKNKNSIVYKVVPSTILYNSKSPELNNGLTVVDIEEILRKI